jgi:hypothetical protein
LHCERPKCSGPTRAPFSIILAFLRLDCPSLWLSSCSARVSGEPSISLVAVYCSLGCAVFCDAPQKLVERDRITSIRMK